MFSFPIRWFVLENVYLKILFKILIIMADVIAMLWADVIAFCWILVDVITKIDNGMLLNYILMADVIAICGWWNATNV